MRGCKRLGLVAAAVWLTASAAPAALAQEEALEPQKFVPSHFDVSPPLRDIKPVEPKAAPPRAIVNRTLPKLAKGGWGDDRTVQAEPGSGEMPAPLLSFEGLSNANNQTVVGFMITPPDTQGDVGPNHYFQWINLVFAIYDKSGNKVYPPQPGAPAAAGNTIWTGFPGNCATDNDGDPVVLYDHLADRWLVSQFSTTSPFRECVAVSTTGDPTGSYYRYEYVMTNSKFPDYPKFGVWPNAYYMSANQFSGSTWAGQGVFAFDRAAMIAGNATAAVIYVDLFGVNSNFGNAFPADLDGPPPPAGADGIFLEWDDSTWLGDPTDTIRLWLFHPDFAVPANSTFGLNGQPNQLIPTANVDPDMCAFNRSCIPMPAGGESVDAISDRLMHRLQYRNFGTHQTIVTATTVDADATDHAGVHWFELRKTGAGAWGIQQEGTYAPDAAHRWMGSAAMDTNGNIAVGYSVSSTSIFPSVRYAGRLAGDPAGTLGQGEATLVAGGAVFTQGGNNRWGDYSMLAVDPVDECTFWYTQEYAAVPGGSWLWNTRIGSFKFPSCSLAPTFTLAVTPSTQDVCAPASATYTVNVGSVSGFNSPVTLSATGNPAGTTTGYSPNPVTPLPGSSTLTIGNTVAAAAGSYVVNVAGSSAGPINQTTNVTLNVFTANPAAPTLTAPANGALNQAVSPTFTWSAVAQTATYTLEIATDAGFTNIVHTGSGIAATTYSGATLNTNTTYFWRVRSTNSCGTGTNSAVFSFTTLAAPGDCGIGTTANILYQYGFESGAGPWTHSGTGDTWAISTTNPHAGTSHFRGLDPAAVSDQRLLSPPVVIPTGQNPVTLSFWHLPNLENSGTTACFDGGILEASTDGGTTFTQVPNANLLVGPYTGAISASFSNPLAGLQGWCNGTAYINTIADVSSLAGQTVQFRFRLGSDTSVSDVGWDVDDVKVQSCQPSGPTCPNVDKGDFNNDSKVDLLFDNLTNNRNMVWFMDGVTRTSMSWISPDAAANQEIVGSDDFNGDGQSDLLLWNNSTGALEFWMMNGATRTGAGVPISGAPTLATNWKLAATGDFNADGKPDLLWRNTTSQKLVIWTMNGTTKTGNIVPTPDQAVDFNWVVAAALDYNNDGARDLLWYNFTSGKIVLWFMNASVVRITGQFTNPANAGDNNWNVYAGGDFGVGSGGTNCTNDIVWRNATSGKEVVWYMDFAGNRTFGVFTIPDSPTSDPDGNPTPATNWIVAGPR